MKTNENVRAYFPLPTSYNRNRGENNLAAEKGRTRLVCYPVTKPYNLIRILYLTITVLFTYIYSLWKLIKVIVYLTHKENRRSLGS